MFRWLYNLCFPIVLLILLPGYLGRMLRRGGYRAQFGQRFGWYTQALRKRLSEGPPGLWLQAVSVGEMLVALKLVSALRAQSPDVRLMLSTTTSTGYRLAKDRAPTDVDVIYSPVDFLPIVKRVFRVLRPAAMVIVDGGLWPNQLWEAERLGIPAALVSARLSPRSEKRFLRFAGQSAELFKCLNLVTVPEIADVQRWSRLGVPAKNIQVTGSIKYDDADQNNTHGEIWREVLDAVGVEAERPILLAASTHEGEELVLAELLLKLRASVPGLFLILVPRHVERTEGILKELASLPLEIVRRSTYRGEKTFTAPATGDKPADLLLLDTTGELADWFAAATVVFIGKSLTAFGGHNPSEAIAAMKPVVTGAHMENFEGLMQALLDADAIVQVRDPEALLPAFTRLFQDSERRKQLASSAYRQLEKHRGAASRNAALLLARR